MSTERAPLVGLSSDGASLSEQCPDEVFDAFGDPVSRSILVAAAEQPVTVEGLAHVCDVSVSTVYRRLDTLISAGLVERLPALSSSESPTYRTLSGTVTVRFGDGDVSVRSAERSVDGCDELEAAVETLLDQVAITRVDYDPEDDTVGVRLRADDETVRTCLQRLVEERTKPN